MDEPKTSEVVPGDAARTPEVSGNFCSHFFWNTYRFSNGVAAHEERPRRKSIRPELRRSRPCVVRRGVSRAALRNEGLLDEASGLVASDLAIEDVREASLGVLMNGLERVFEGPERGRMRDRNVIVRRIWRNVSFFHRIHDRLDVAGTESDVVGHTRSAGRVEVDRGGRRAAGGLGAQNRIFELKIGFNVKVFL
jgi:hypothetical protein